MSEQDEVRTPRIRRWKRGAFHRIVASIRAIGDGWWEFWLECGHGGKALLGPVMLTHGQTLKCVMCKRAAAKARPQ